MERNDEAATVARVRDAMRQPIRRSSPSRIRTGASRWIRVLWAELVAMREAGRTWAEIADIFNGSRVTLDGRQWTGDMLRRRWWTEQSRRSGRSWRTVKMERRRAAEGGAPPAERAPERGNPVGAVVQRPPEAQVIAAAPRPTAPPPRRELSLTPPGAERRPEGRLLTLAEELAAKAAQPPNHPGTGVR